MVCHGIFSLFGGQICKSIVDPQGDADERLQETAQL